MIMVVIYDGGKVIGCEANGEACLAGKISRWFGKSDMLASSEISSLS